MTDAGSYADIHDMSRAQPPGREPREVARILYPIERQHEDTGRLDTEAHEAAGVWRAYPAPESRQALTDVLGQLIHALHEHMGPEEHGIFPLIKDRARPDGIPFPSGPLTGAERRILRYLPTHLSAREIAAQLFCSVNTVKTHQRHVYAKLGANSRTEAVMRARALGMLVSGTDVMGPPVIAGRPGMSERS